MNSDKEKLDFVRRLLRLCDDIMQSDHFAFESETALHLHDSRHTFDVWVRPKQPAVNVAHQAEEIGNFDDSFANRKPVVGSEFCGGGGGSVGASGKTHDGAYGIVRRDLTPEQQEQFRRFYADAGERQTVLMTDECRYELGVNEMSRDELLQLREQVNTRLFDLERQPTS